jgi:hypothetical protein
MPTADGRQTYVSNESKFAGSREARITLFKRGPLRAVGEIEEVSGRLVRIWLSHPPGLEVGTRVRVDVDGIVFAGELRYCVTYGAGCGVGLRLDRLLRAGSGTSGFGQRDGL